jgi:flavin-dependent dehydrogenase
VAPRGGFDVVVAGASIAGCTAARQLGRAGARVAVVEKSPDPAAYKVACTHAFQPSAAPTVERIGLAPLLEREGAARPRAAAWTPYGGWLRFPSDAPAGYGITRRRLDPMMRELAAGTPGVEVLHGRRVAGLVADGSRVGGLEVETADGSREVFRARLTVAADGRDSTVARLAAVPARVLPHRRFVYFAYWTGVDSPRDLARLWFLDPDAGAVFPNEEGLTLIAAVAHNDRLPEFRADTEAAYERFIREIPEGPGLDGAERVSGLIGKLSMPNKIRPAARPGLAFVGDAALAADPLFGVGCGWALQSSEWLADEVAPALLGDGDVDRALRRYRRAFARRLAPHHLLISDFSTGRPIRWNERVGFRAAARDAEVGEAMERFATRRSSPWRVLLDPVLNARILAAGLRPSPAPAGAD